MSRGTIALAIAVLVLSACGGDDDNGSANGEADTSGDEAAESESAQPGSGAGESATAVLGGETYEFSTVTCTLGGATLLNFSEGSEQGSISVADTVVLIRLAVDGGNWVDDGSPAEPDRAGDTFTWSGSLSEMSSGDMAEATITVSC